MNRFLDCRYCTQKVNSDFHVQFHVSVVIHSLAGFAIFSSEDPAGFVKSVRLV